MLAGVLEVPTDKESDPSRKTKSVRVAHDLAAMLKLIEAANEAQQKPFNAPAYLSSILRPKITSDYRKAKEYFASEDR